MSKKKVVEKKKKTAAPKKVDNKKKSTPKKDDIKETKETAVVVEQKSPSNIKVDKYEPVKQVIKKDGLINEEIGPVVNDNMMRYTLSTLIARALPDVIDGFKPGQRMFLWGAKQAGADGENTIKSGTIVGEVMGKYHPHGDASIYKTGCRMVGSALHLLVPFIVGQGGFGKHFDSKQAPAASRYTEMKLAPLTKEVINDCTKFHETNMVENFDGKLKQPKYLSMPFPAILANAQSGIAVAYSCEFGSFNLKEICEASKIVVKNFKKSNKELLADIRKVMPTMDFTTGGETNIDDEQITNVYLNGQGAITCRAIFENNQKERKLELKQLPYSTDIQAIMNAVLKAADNGKLPEVSNIKNLADKKGFNVGIYYKSGTDVEDLKKKLFALTPCQSALNVNMMVVDNNTPKQMGVIDCIKRWIEHRKVWVEESINGQIKEKSDYLHLLEGLQKILLDIDKAIKIVRNSKTDAEVIDGLKKAFKLDDIQAEYVANIKLRNLNKDYILNKTKEIKDLKAQIADLQKRLKDIDTELINGLDDTAKKYGEDRKTTISKSKWEELPTFAVNSKPEVKLDGESLVFCGTDTIKRVPTDSAAKAPNGTTKYIVPNKDEILIFTNTAKVYKWIIGQVPNNNQVKITDIKKIKKKMEAGEQITYITPLIKKNKICIFFNNGKAVKIPCEAWATEGSKLLFKKGVSDKASIDHIEAIEKDCILEVNGQKYDTKKIKECGSKTGQGSKIKPEK